jgi:hypothetical protein
MSSLTYLWAAEEKCHATTTAVLADATTIFTVAGGPIQILELLAVCTVTNVGTATTLGWSSVPTVGTATAISGASASLTNCAAGSTVKLTPTALSTAPVIALQSAGGVQLGLVAQNHIIVLDGTIRMDVATALSTARWYFCLRYKPLTLDALVS